MVPYVDHVVAEIRRSQDRATELSAHLPTEVRSIYFGGGTPSLLPPELFQKIADALRGEFAFSQTLEWTVECAPGQLSDATLHTMVAAGVSRFSFGVQSFVDRETASVGRLHDRTQSEAAARQVRSAGVENISIDLLAGLPYQTHASWTESMEAAIALNVQHVSVYMLEVDDDSRLGRELIVLGDKYQARSVPDDDAIADFYEMACDRLNSAGIAQYEISNFARGGYESAHNLRYWQRRPYLGFGLDAHSCLRKHDGELVRFANVEGLAQYMQNVAGSIDVVDAARRLEEAWFLGLRRNLGVNASEVRREFGEAALEMEESASVLVEDGLLEYDGGVYRLTPRGRMISNDVFARFVTETGPVYA